MNKTRRWAVAWTAGAILNIALFATVAYLVSQANAPEPMDVASVKLIVLEPKIPVPPPPIPPPPKPVMKPPLVKKIEPRPLPEPEPEPVPEPETAPEPETMGLDPTKEPEPEAPPAPPPPPPPAEPEYIPSHKLTRLPAYAARIEPIYPENERFTGRDGRVTAEILLNAEGTIDSIKIIKSGGAAFDSAVIKALQESRFTPGYMDGRPVAVRVQIPFLFKLK